MEVMNAVWDHDGATVADVWRALSARRTVSRTTVLTMLKRLEEKGWLRREKDGRSYRYRAALPREATLSVMVQRLVDTAFQGSAVALVTALMRDCTLSESETRKIKQMLARGKRQAS